MRFTDAVTSEESIVFVEAVASPELIEIPKVPGDTNLNSMAVATQTASVFRTTGSSLQIKFLCPDGVDLESSPSWLKVEKTKEEGAETVFTLTLLGRDVADTEGTVIFHNSKKPDNLKTDLSPHIGIKTGPEKEVFLLAAGCRHDSDGTLAYSGTRGDIWSSTPSGSTHAYRLTLNSGGRP